MSDTAVHYRRLVAGDRLGEWQLVARTGSDVAGEIWDARHRTLDRRATVTVATDPAQAVALRQCGQAHQRIDDPRVVRTLGLALAEQPPYLVTEPVLGDALRTVLRGGPLPWTQACAIARELLATLAIAHRHRVVHGALRPDRIYLPPAGGIQLTGFGLPATLGGGGSADVVISDVLDPEGIRQARALEYVAPEQRQGQPATVAGDLYAVGVIGFEMCVGDLPHGAETAHELRREVPAAVAAVWQRASGRAELRHPTAAAMLAALPAANAARSGPPTERVPVAVPVAQPTAQPVAKIRIGADGAVSAADDITFGDGRARCPACGHGNALSHRYCTRCGAGLHA